WAVIAQFAYYLAGFPWYEGNILFAFAVAAQMLTWCETRSGWRSVGAILLLAVIPALNPATSDAAAVAGLVMTVLTAGLVSCAGKSLPRFWPGDFFPAFYAGHLAVLGVLVL
ncbi:hypothetical protein BBD15_005441, partial [Escherichia coli]|nr:hypothetical protein [Escherichia coli]HDQ2139827.1 hypothetical protein [Escherichia coli]